MTSDWINFLDKVNETIQESESDILFYRGHSNGSWSLDPYLLRCVKNKQGTIYNYESRIYYDFISNGGPHLSNTNKKSWEILFLMQHYGVPTRLLDWTENFATALYFALEGKNIIKPTIWILDPYKLNNLTEGVGNLINPDLDLENDYYETFIRDKGNSRFEYPVALYPHRENQRLFNQKGLFTLHGKQTNSIEFQAPNCVTKIEIPTNSIQDAKNFMDLAGVNTYSIFNDLDSLSKQIKARMEFE